MGIDCPSAESAVSVNLTLDPIDTVEESTERWMSPCSGVIDTDPLPLYE